MVDRVEITTETMVLPTGCPADDVNVHAHAVWVRWNGVRGEGPRARGGWSVEHLGSVLSRAGKWAWRPSNYQRWQYRFDTRDEALRLARLHVDGLRVNGRTYTEWQARHAARREEG